MSVRPQFGHLQSFRTFLFAFLRRGISGSESPLCLHSLLLTCLFSPGRISVTCSRRPRSRIWSSHFLVISTWVKRFRHCIGPASVSSVSGSSSWEILRRARPRLAEDARSSLSIYCCCGRNRRRAVCHAGDETH